MTHDKPTMPPLPSRRELVTLMVKATSNLSRRDKEFIIPRAVLFLDELCESTSIIDDGWPDLDDLKAEKIGWLKRMREIKREWSDYPVIFSVLETLSLQWVAMMEKYLNPKTVAQKSPPSKRGRKPEYSPREDNRIYDKWKAQRALNGRLSFKQFQKEHYSNSTVHQIKNAIERERKRKDRMISQ